MQGQQAGQVQVSGDATALKRLLAYASKFEKTFNLMHQVQSTSVEPDSRKRTRNVGPGRFIQQYRRTKV